MPSLKHVSLRKYLKSMIVGGLYDVPREALSWGALYAVCTELGRYTDHRFKIKRIPDAFRVYKLPRERTMTFRKWMKEMGIIAVLVMLLLPVSILAASKTVTFEWTKTSLEADLAGFGFYKASAAGGPYTKIVDIPFVPGQTTYTSPQNIVVPDNTETTLYFVVDAYDTSGNRSVKSNEVFYKFDFLGPGGTIVLIIKTVTTP